MSTFLSEEVLAGLQRAKVKTLRKKNRLRVHVGEEIYPVLRSWDGGFALQQGRAPQFRGLVDLYDGANHLSQCLVITSSLEGDEVIYEYKRETAASEDAPVDFARDAQAPVALIGRSS